ncbi:hypothetical protein [Microterricola viridarii]|uniref:hypothetical protein n=1 Tax=Microterricola viridarii TaxID=412690 RepID=UPI0009EBB4D9|nr:hypothetical protein [Microterricola viridarii]
MTLPRPENTDDTAGGVLSGADTIVSYPRGDTANTAVVLHCEPLGDGAADAAGTARWAVLLDTSSCHPVDAGWPDQGPDRAVLRLADGDRPIIDCVVAATDGTALHLGSGIPVRKGTPGWAFVVAHIVDDPSGIAEGHRVEVVVDADYRLALSHGHSGCHLAALALNRALAARWGKAIRNDGLGQPDFDGAAIDSSRIAEYGSVDTYRLNKSLRRKGFDTEGLADQLPVLEEAINATLAGWVAGDAPIRVEAEGPRLTDRRSWVCELPEATVSIPCGGTHAHSLAELGQVRVVLTLDEVDGTPVLTMTTAVGEH